MIIEEYKMQSNEEDNEEEELMLQDEQLNLFAIEPVEHPDADGAEKKWKQKEARIRTIH